MDPIYQYKSAFNFLWQGEGTAIAITGPGNHPPIHGSPAPECSHVYPNMVSRDNKGGSFLLVTRRKLSDPF